MVNLKDKVALVTGAGGNIGKEITKRLFNDGCKVVMIGRDHKKLAGIKKELGDDNDLLAISADITKEADVLSCIEQTLTVFNKIDILVNNAGVINDPIEFHLSNHNDWMNLINTNLIGMFRITKAVIPIMMENKYGNIINISSLLGIRSILGVPLTVYGTTKAGVIMFTKGIAVEYGKFGIRSNCITLSTIRGPMIEPYLNDANAKSILNSSFPLQKIGNPEDVPGAVSYLCSEDSSWVTGITLNIDGGISASQ